jgi:hypothetical protein
VENIRGIIHPYVVVEKSLRWKIVEEDKMKLEITTMVNSNRNCEAYCGLIGKVLNI